MGSSVSKQDRNTAKQMCKGRLKHIEQAIDARYALSAAQLSYEQSLRNVGVALRQFVESQHEGDPEKSPRSSSALPSRLPPADSANYPSPPPIPRRSDVSCLRSAVSTSLKVTVNPSSGSFVKEGETISTSISPPLPSEVCSSWDFFDPNDVIQNAASHVSDNSQSIHMGSLEDCVHGDEKDFASSISSTSPIVEVQEQLETYGCKDDDNLNDLKLNHNDCNEIEIADKHLPNDSILEKGTGQVQNQVVERHNPTTISNDRKNEAHYVDKVNLPKRSCSEEDKGSFIAIGSKGFLSVVKELEHQFTRAAESCHEVSRMLETRKVRLSVSSQITGEDNNFQLYCFTELLFFYLRNIGAHYFRETVRCVF